MKVKATDILKLQNRVFYLQNQIYVLECAENASGNAAEIATLQAELEPLLQQLKTMPSIYANRQISEA